MTPTSTPKLSERYPVFLAALAFACLVPVICVLWFMTAAMRNERLAAQERLREVYVSQLSAMERQLDAFWQERITALRLFPVTSASETFAALVRNGLADAVVIVDPAGGKPVYPTMLNGPTAKGDEDGGWRAARELEFQKNDFGAAARAYAGLAESSRDIHGKARALLAESSAWLKAGDKSAALVRLSQLAGDATLRDAVSLQGLLIAPSAQLLLLQLLALEPRTPALAARHPENEHPRESPPARRVMGDFLARLNDYADPKLSSAQRRFLMHELTALAPDAAQFPALAAEDLAASYLEGNHPLPAAEGVLESTTVPKVWRLTTPNRNLIALYREERIRSESARLLRTFAIADAYLRLRAPGEPDYDDAHQISAKAGGVLAGWQLSLAFPDVDPFAAASRRQTQFYLWSGSLVVVVIGLVAFLVARTVSAQMRLARMKNDLVSTVSHELKTPLASMRALVDTLAAGGYRDEQQLRDYLGLLAKENARLSGLIDNFLTFSRLERGQQQFQFESLEPARVVDDAVGALQEKLHATNCTFAQRVDPGLPRIRGDASALSTVLINLLDNAHKYTDGDKRISARAFAQNGHVCFEVSDNGIGIARPETDKIFDRFYQVDQSLTRQRGGCGLGLGIVRTIVRAHEGDVQVESEPGKGSTFRVSIPVAKTLDV